MTKGKNKLILTIQNRDMDDNSYEDDDFEIPSDTNRENKVSQEEEKEQRILQSQNNVSFFNS